MERLRTRHLAGWAFLLTAVAALTLQPARAENEIAAAAKSARPLSKDRLEKIYADQTWYWPDGAGYFAVIPGRKFTAWTGSGPKSSYAEGTWSATDDGQLCFAAIWHAVKGSRSAKTCFDHREDDAAIYQRRLPSGNWYVFGHLPKQAADEISKFKSGDQISSDFQKNKQFVADHHHRRHVKSHRHHGTMRISQTGRV